VIQVCPLHHDADDLTRVALDSGASLFRCSRTGHYRPGPHVWGSCATGADRDGGSNEGIMEDLGLYESLLGAVSVSAGWVEYGLPEYCFSQARPEAFHE